MVSDAFSVPSPKKRMLYHWLPWLIAVMTLIAGGAGFLVLRHVEATMVASQGHALATLAATIAGQLDQTLFERYGDLKANAPVLARLVPDRAAQSRHLIRLKENYLYYRWLGVTDAAGRVVAATDPASVGTDQSGASWFRQARDRREVIALDVVPSVVPGSEDRAVTFAASLQGPRGEFLGVVAGQVSLASLEDAMGRAMQAFRDQVGMGRQIEWQLLSQDGVLLVDSLLREQGQGTNLVQFQLPSALASAEGGPGWVVEEHLRRKVLVVTGYARTSGYGEFPGFGWRVLVRMDRADILVPIHRVLRTVGVAGGLLWLPMLGLLLWMTGRLREEWHLAGERQAELQTTLMSIGDAVIVTDAEGRVAFMNPVAETLTGWQRAQAAGKPLETVFVIVNETTRQAVESPVAKVLREGIVVGLANHTVLIAKNGAEVPIDDSGAPIRDPEGRLIGVVLVFRDIRDRRRIVAALKESEQRFRSLVESATDGIVVADREGFILSSNPAAQRLFGYSEEELLGRPLTMLMPERYRAAYRRGMEQARVEGESRPSSLVLEVHGLRKDGMEFPVECAIARWSIGGTIYYSGILRDVSERKRAERRLAAQYGVTRCLAEARTLIEAAPSLLRTIGEGLDWDLGALWVVDRRAGLLRCLATWQAPTLTDEGFAALTRQSTFTRGVGLPGRIWASGAPNWIPDVWEDDNFPRRPAARQASLHGGFGFPILVGREVYGVVECFSRAVRRPDPQMLEAVAEMGIKIGQFIEHRDLEEQFRQIQKMDSIGRLAGGVAHDFNNLLTVINGYSEMLVARLDEAAPLRRYAAEIRKAGERAGALTNQLLAFSRRQVLEPRRFNLNDRVRAMESLLKRLIGEDIDLVLVLAEDLGLVMADPSQLDQVIMNLASNARDAMPDGGQLTIETANVALDADYARRHALVRPGEYVMLSVTDTGCGMDAETQTRIFEPFFTTKEHGKGTGLGLSTVYGIVRQSGGTIWVYSEVNRGTTFKIYLPRVREESEATAPAAAVAPALTGAETVLLVEDEDGVRALAEETLTAAGYRVLTARHGADALVRAHGHQGRIHLLLTDVVMPGMSGRQLADRLLSLIPGLKILYMSGYTDNAVVHQGVLDPGVAYLPKPFSPEGLLRKVRAVLDAM